MIKMIERIPAGNALRLFLEPPATAAYWRLLRRTADTFAGPDDAGAVVVVDQSTDPVIMDTGGLVNTTEYFYRAYYWDGAAWAASATNHGSPVSSYTSIDTDPLLILRDRLRLGLADAVARGVLKPHGHSIPVLTAPFAAAKDASFPCVSVHLDSDAHGDRFLGEELSADMPDGIGGSVEGEGWHNAATINVVGVSLNPDERIALRRAIKAIIIANLPVFDAKDLWHVEFSQRDNEDFQSSNAPLYLTVGTFTCVYPAFVFDTKDVATDIKFTMSHP